MQVERLKCEDNNRLAIYVLGWACDWRLIRHIDAPDHDILCIYDYRDFGEVLEGRNTGVIEKIRDAVGQYSRHTLIAWSFGVWVSERLFGNAGIVPVSFDKATALNGTPFPGDEQSGIGARRLMVTIRGLAKGGKEEFDRKTYGRWYDDMADKLSSRPVKENVEELQALTTLASVVYLPSIEWSAAIVGEQDVIFPPENMLRYWEAKAKRVPLPHFPFGDENIIKELF